MVIVIAVMGILMGIAFRGFGAIQQGARDTRRIADLRTVATQLELYFARCGHYPTGNACRTASPAGTLLWGSLTNRLAEVVRAEDVPDDPVVGRYYRYGFGLNGLSFVLAATLERGGNNPDVAGNIDGINCSDTNVFCIRN